jgi:SAM-dependent methyltransferase
MQPYNKSFARAYNLMWTDFADRVAPRILEFYKRTGPGRKKKPVLDLCCGAGTLALHFLAAGYETVGVDLSKPMLAIAKDNAREFIKAGKAEFIKADAAKFRLDKKFGLVASVFDSLNHLEDSKQLGQCFDCVHEALLPGGLFIFDLNTKKGLKRWDEITVDDDDERMVVKRGGFDADKGKAYYKVSGYIRRNRLSYNRFEQTVVETVFDMHKVKDMLISRGFKSAYFASANALETPISDPEDQSRAFFIVRK